jgi:hypothetical protein
MVHFITSVVMLAATVLAAPHPQPEQTAADAAAPKPYKGNTTINYFVGQAGGAGSTDAQYCSMDVANGTLQQKVCNTFTTSSVGIAHVPGYDCSLTFFSNDAKCGGTNNQKVIALPKGNGTTCVGTGVLDGGKYYHGSGIWSCP